MGEHYNNQFYDSSPMAICAREQLSSLSSLKIDQHGWSLEECSCKVSLLEQLYGQEKKEILPNRDMVKLRDRVEARVVGHNRMGH